MSTTNLHWISDVHTITTSYIGIRHFYYQFSPHSFKQSIIMIFYDNWSYVACAIPLAYSDRAACSDFTQCCWGSRTSLPLIIQMSKSLISIFHRELSRLPGAGSRYYFPTSHRILTLAIWDLLPSYSQVSQLLFTGDIYHRFFLLSYIMTSRHQAGYLSNKSLSKRICLGTSPVRV